MDKSPRKSAVKKAGRSLKEKRAVKKTKKADKSTSLIPPTNR